jgi:glycosyltransferase involved in cell wall biosynthesis
MVNERKLMGATEKYNLVHVTVDGEYKAPLVASQLFDQAECQAVNKGDAGPEKVEAWIIGAMREYVDVAAQAKVTALMLRCPHIAIRMANGIGRMGHFPIIPLMKYYRRRLGKLPVIYHCRGESAAEWAMQVKQFFPGDKVVLDVRGYWPAEKLYMTGIEYPEKATGTDLDEYNRLRDRLSGVVKRVDAITTVSESLRQLLIDEMGASPDCAVVPCCVTNITSDAGRAELRKSWGVGDNEVVVVYSGTTAAYQHLEDLTIPFMKKLAASNPRVKLAFFSSQVDKIKTMLSAAGVDMKKVLLKSFQQNEVAAALTACDAGILIRKPTLVNRVANPVKIAEYLAAGLPIIIEKGVGGVAEEMYAQSLLMGIEMTKANADIDRLVAATNGWIGDGTGDKRTAVRQYASRVYLWNSAIHVSRKMYLKALEK